MSVVVNPMVESTPEVIPKDTCDTGEENEVVYVPPDPFHLKEKGNKFFSEENYTAAIEMYQQGLKQALKTSVRCPSRELSDLQVTLRMNLAMAFIKEDDWVMAKEHMLVVLDSGHQSAKAYFRMAEIYEGLQDLERAFGVVQCGLEVYPNTPSLIELRNRIITAIKKDSEKKAELKIDISELKDDRIDQAEKSLAPIFDVSEYEDILTDKAVLNGDESVNKAISMCDKLIQWRYKSDTVFKCEVASDIDDFKNSLFWKTPWDAGRFESDRSVLHLSLPLTILSVVENFIRASVTSIVTKPFITRDEIMDTSSTPTSVKKLPVLSHISKPGEVVDARAASKVRLSLVENFSRGSQRTKTRPLVVHVLGSRGDFEMETQWSALLERLPYVDVLTVVMVGFCDNNDPYKNKLPNEGDEYLSPPLSKNIGVRPYQRFIARLYKGHYQSFVKSKLTAGKIQDEMTFNRHRFESGEGDQSVYELPEILSDDRHPLYPDIVMIPEPNMSRHFDSWTPVLAMLALSNIPVIMTGHSVIEFPSHEALQFRSILPHFKLQILSDLAWNAFMIPIAPGRDYPPMPVRLEDGTEIGYKGLSAKNAVTILFCGLDAKLDGSELIKHRHHLVKLIEDAEEVVRLRKELALKGCDVEREFLCRAEYEEDSKLQQLLADQEKRKEEEIEKAARKLRETIENKLTSK